jgi:acetylornithine deacetylase/succinyl-diaminopimelate desuccinylase-like protein
MGRLITLIAALVAGAMIAWMAQQPPKPALASAPATAFSAQRAMVDDRMIAAVPHPIGSDANHVVRDDLLRRMTELGLAPQVHRGTAAYASSRRKGLVLGGEVENLVGVLPGRDRSAPALALMAHYDSVPGSSGLSLIHI